MRAEEREIALRDGTRCLLRSPRAEDGEAVLRHLRRVSGDQQAVYCRRLEEGLYLLLPWIYVLYLPGRALLEAWLPEYQESLAYLALVLPICYFDCKMNLLGNTFLKVLNRQTQLLKINLATILASLALSAAGIALSAVCVGLSSRGRKESQR